MSNKSPSPERWQMWRRLRASGCPIDCEHLRVPDYPYQVASTPWSPSSNFFPLDEGLGIVFGVRIVASVATTICGFRLEAEWLTDPVRWVDPCPEHDGRYCFHRTPASQIRLNPDNVLNRRIGDAGGLKRGGYLRGLLVGETSSPVPPKPPQGLEATLWIEDLYGTCRPYAVMLKGGTLLFGEK